MDCQVIQISLSIVLQTQTFFPFTSLKYFTKKTDFLI